MKSASVFERLLGVVFCQFVLVLFLVGVLFGKSLAGEYWVTNLNGDTSPGSLRDIVSKVQQGDTIRFDPSLSGVITLNESLSLPYPITYIDNEDIKLSLSGNGSVELLSNSGFLYGALSGDLSVTSSGDAIATSAHRFNMDTVSGIVSAVSTGGKALGIFGIQGINLDSLSGVVSVYSKGDVAYGVVGSSDVSIGEMSGDLSAVSTHDVAFGIWSGLNLNITTLSGNVLATSSEAGVIGLRSYSMKIDEISGTIQATAEAGRAVGLLFNVLSAADGSATVIASDGSISARGGSGAAAVQSYEMLNLQVFGTLKAEDTSGAKAAFAILGMGTGRPDRVLLGEGAHVTGAISFESGNSFLTMDGSGTLIGDVIGVTTLTKSGTGTWSAKGTVKTNDLAVDSGTLLVNVVQTAHPTIQVAGTVTNNGNIFFVPSAPIARGETFTVLSSGRLEGSGTYSYSPLFEETVSGNNLELTKLSFADAVIGAKPNVGSLAAALDANYNSVDPAMQSIITTLEQSSKADFDQSMDEMTTLHTGITTSMSVDTAQLVSVVTQTRMSEMRTYQTMLADSDQSPDPNEPETWPMVASVGDLSGVLSRSPEHRPNSLYLRAMGRTGSMDSYGGYDGYSYDSILFSGGYDRVLGDSFLAGVSAGYAETEADYKDVGDSDSTLESYTLGMYGSWFKDAWYVDGILAGAYNEYDFNRQLSAMGATATSSPTGYSLSAKTEAGHRFDFGSYGLTPTASLEYTRFHQDGYAESGAGAANLIIDDMDSNFLENGIGGKFDRILATDSFQVISEVSLMWMHEWLTQKRDITYSMTGMPGIALSQKTAEGANDSLRLSAALRAVFNSTVSTALRYQGEVEEHGRSHSLMLETQIAF